MTKQLLAAILMEARYQQYRASSFHNQLGRLNLQTMEVMEMDKLDHVSTVLAEMRAELYKRRDEEISMAGDVLPQYVTDHNDRSAYRAIDREVTALARAWDKMIAKLDKWEAEASKIETSCSNFYGD